MDFALKPLREQVIVITGASSGINLVAARQAAGQGARVLLVSRNEEVMRTICEDIRSRGRDAAVALLAIASGGNEAARLGSHVVDAQEDFMLPMSCGR